MTAVFGNMDMRQLLLVKYLVLSAYATATCNEPVIGYYWRDYVGEIPYDAIPGGTDKSGKPTYIGQANIKNCQLLLLPATITTGSITAVASAGGNVMQTDKNIKILCGNQLEKFSWLVTKSEEAHLITNCHLVIGGTEGDHILHIGRVNHNGRTVVGKVFSYREGGKGLWIPHEGHEMHYKSYEILTYNCNSNIGK